jgi:hypothetical protein
MPAMTLADVDAGGAPRDVHDRRRHERVIQDEIGLPQE